MTQTRRRSKARYSGFERTIPLEHDEQVAVFKWAALHFKRWPALRFMYAVPNGAWTGSVKHAVRLKAEGLKPGVPDLVLPCARGNYHGLYIEMKRVKGGKVSPEQHEYIAFLRAEGYCVEVCQGHGPAVDAINRYMRLANE